MNEVITKEMKEEKYIEDMIYEIRGTQVMLDSDVAKLYQVETRNRTSIFLEDKCKIFHL